MKHEVVKVFEITAATSKLHGQSPSPLHHARVTVDFDNEAITVTECGDGHERALAFALERMSKLLLLRNPRYETNQV